MSRLAPCKDCPDRAAGCHSTCERYAEFKAVRAAENKARADFSRAHSAMMEGRQRVKETSPSKITRRR